MSSATMIRDKQRVLKQKFDEICEKINVLQKRERLILALVALSVVYALVQLIFLDPMLKEHKSLDSQMGQIRQEIATLQNEEQVLNAVIQIGPNHAQEQQLQKLTDQLAKLDAQLRASTVALIPPALMPEVMQGVLGEIKGLYLLSIENQPARPLLSSSETSRVDKQSAANNQTDAEQSSETNDVEKNAETSQPRVSLYRHHFVLTMEGDFQATSDFLKALEDKPWKFFWQDLHYEVIKYPKARIVLDVYTLSTERDWIGV